tara:strand:+ start:1311 stop:1718 length:408 start_codon:yes stop_codon:yes gene_type:complete
MAKYNDPWEDTMLVFDAVVSRLNLENVRIKVLGDNNLKRVVCKVQKANDLLKYETNNDVYVFINEIIFEGLTDELKVLAIDEVLSGIVVNAKGNISVKAGDIKTFSGLIRKHTYENYEILQESVKTLFEVQKQKE